MKHTHTRGALANDNTDFSQYQGRTSDFQAVFRGRVIVIAAGISAPELAPISAAIAIHANFTTEFHPPRGRVKYDVQPLLA